MKASKDLEMMLGDPKVAIRSMMLPLVISYLIVQVNVFADTSWCSGLGDAAASAVSTIFPIYWVISCLGTGIGIGASTSISRHLGKDEKTDADSVATQTIVLSVIMGVILTPVFLIIMNPLIDWIGVSEIKGLCWEYMFPIIITTVVSILNGAIAGILRSEGAAKKSMIVLMSAAIINMVLDPLMIYGMGMGLSGAGWATVIATVISTVIAFYWYMTNKMFLTISFKDFHIKKDEMKDVLFVGIPRVTESTLVGALSLVQRVLIVPVAGIMGIAMYNIPWRYVSIAMVISQAAGSALIPVCSAALGRNDNQKAEKGFRYAFTVTTIVMIILSVLVIVFAEYLIIPFSTSESMVPYRAEMAFGLRIYALTFVFMGMIDIGSSILQSLRMATASMFMSFVRNIILVGLLFFAHNMDDIYWQLFVIEVIGGTLMMWMAIHEFRKYKRKRLLIPKRSAA